MSEIKIHFHKAMDEYELCSMMSHIKNTDRITNMSYRWENNYFDGKTMADIIPFSNKLFRDLVELALNEHNADKFSYTVNMESKNAKFPVGIIASKTKNGVSIKYHGHLKFAREVIKQTKGFKNKIKYVWFLIRYKKARELLFQVVGEKLWKMLPSPLFCIGPEAMAIIGQYEIGGSSSTGGCPKR